MKSEKSGKGVTEKKLHLLRSYDHDMRNPEGALYLIRQDTPEPTLKSGATTVNYGVAEQLHVWQVARAATAAPFYFREISFPRGPLEGKRTQHFSDGGFGAQNNPTKLGIREIETMYGLERVGAIVNVGTSRSSVSGGNGTKDIVKAAFGAVTDPQIVAEELEGQKFSWRFNDGEGIGVELDEWKPSGRFANDPGHKTLDKIRQGFHRWAADGSNQRMITACAKELVKRRRQRIHDMGRWEVFATCAAFKCGYPECGDAHAPFRIRRDLLDHYTRIHKVPDGDADAMVERATKKWRYQDTLGSQTHRA